MNLLAVLPGAPQTGPVLSGQSLLAPLPTPLGQGIFLAGLPATQVSPHACKELGKYGDCRQ